MAFSSRVSKAKPSPGAAVATTPVVKQSADTAAFDDGQEVITVEHVEEDQREQEEFPSIRRLNRAEEELKKRHEDERRRTEYEAEKARQTTIARSKAETAKRAGGGYTTNKNEDAGFAWKQNDVEDPAVSRAAATSAVSSRSNRDSEAENLPTHAACEEGISAMISRTVHGMREGLDALGLPSCPLVFEPGKKLILCGHNVREEINEMIHAHMSDERQEFNACLLKIRAIVSKPLLTQEEMEMMGDQDAWVETQGLDGQTMWMKREEAASLDYKQGASRDIGASSSDEVEDINASGIASRLKETQISRDASESTGPSCLSSTSTPAATEIEDYYALLGVDPKASLQDIRIKFRQIVLIEHPEKGGDAQRFAKFNKAYSVLSDQKKRLEYDESCACLG